MKRIQLLLLLPLTALLAQAESLSVQHNKEDKKVTVNIGSELFTEYLYGNESKPILYPIIGPHGIPMTRNHPMKKGVEGEAADHPHHQSLYYGHPINGADFWSGHKGARIRGDKIVEAKVDCQEAVIVSNSSWLQNDKTVCTDTTEICLGTTEGGRYIDYKITIHASHGDITFVETKEGSMAIRTHPALRLKGSVAKGSAINSEGVTGKAVWGKIAKWVDYWGPIDGKTVGIAIFDHPSNPRHPTTWHARDYGLIAANPFGKKYFKVGQGSLDLAKGKSITFKYRFYFHKGSHKDANIAKHYEAWGKK